MLLPALLLLPVLVLLPAARPARADGVIFSSEELDLEEPTQLALLVWDGQTERLTLQARFAEQRGKLVASLGWLLALPAQAEVKETDDRVFRELMEMTHPYEDDDPFAMDCMGLKGDEARAGGSVLDDVHVLDRTVLGAYEITTVTSGGVPALRTWIEGEGFFLRSAADEVLQDYLDRSWVFVAIRVDLGAHESDGLLGPLTFTFPADRPVFPLRITAISGLDADPQGRCAQGMCNSELEVLIYLYADRELAGDLGGAHSEFAHAFEWEDLEDFPTLDDLLPNEGVLTKVRLWTNTESLTQDLYFSAPAQALTAADRSTRPARIPLYLPPGLALLALLLGALRRRGRE